MSDQEELERQMGAELENEANTAEKELEAPFTPSSTPQRPKKLEERMASYEAQAAGGSTSPREATESTEVRRAVGSVKLPEAFLGKKDDEAAKELKKQEEARVDNEKKQKLANRWLQRDETKNEPEIKKNAPEVKTEASEKRKTWEERAQGKVEEKPVEKVNRVDVAADKSKFDEWNKRAQGQVEEKPVEKVTKVDVTADKSKFDEWNKRAEGQVEDKPVEKTVVVDAHGDKSKFDEWNKRAQGQVDDKPVERTVKVELHGDKSKFDEWKQKEANPEVPVPTKAADTPKKTGNIANRWKPEETQQHSSSDARGDPVMSVSPRSKGVYCIAVMPAFPVSSSLALRLLTAYNGVADRWKPEEAGTTAVAPKATAEPAKRGNIASRWNPEGAKDAASDKPAASQAPRAGGSVAKRWEPVVTPAEQNQKKPAPVAATATNSTPAKVEVAKRWNPEPQTSTVAPAREQVEDTTPSTKTVTRGNVTKRWNPGNTEEQKEPVKTAAAPKPSGKVAGRWNVGDGDHAPATGSRASELEEIRKLKEQQKQQDTKPSGSIAGPTYSDADEIAIIAHIAQSSLKSDKELSNHNFSTDAPMGAELADGVVICRLFDKLIPGVLDVRVISKGNEPRDKAENWSLAIGSARGVGCRLNLIQADSCATGNAQQIQAVLWEIIRVAYEQRIKRAKVYLEASFPEHKVADVVKWPADQILAQWLTQFIKNHGGSKTVNDLSADLQDGEALASVLAAVVPSSASVAKISDKSERIAAIVEALNKMENGTIASVNGISNGVLWQVYLAASVLFLKASTVVW